MESNINEVSVIIQNADSRRSKVVHSNRLQHQIQATVDSAESVVTERIYCLHGPYHKLNII